MNCSLPCNLRSFHNFGAKYVHWTTRQISSVRFSTIMTRLQKIREKGVDSTSRTNIVIVPGNGGETLADQTCPHFTVWLDDILASKSESTAISIFHHDIRIDSLASWFAYCEAGEHLLQKLTNMQKNDGLSDDDTLILIGYKLGGFILKKALVEAHRKSHYPHVDALLNSIGTLVMLGCPDLNPSNQKEWTPLISKCLPCKTLPKHLDCPQDARCLQHVADCFEEFTLHSRLFQISSATESKGKNFFGFRAEDRRCICSATMTVRMWTTTDEEFTVPPGEGDKKKCAFYPKSTLYNRLLSIPKNGTQLSISASPAHLPVLETRSNNFPSDGFPMGENVTDVAVNDPVSPQAAFLAMPPISTTDTVLATTAESVDGTDITSATEYDASSTDLGDQNPDPGKRLLDSSAARANEGLESSPHQSSELKPLERIISEQARHQGSVKDTMQHDSPDVLPLLHCPRSARRPPFLSMRIPSRDAKFFGREGLLTLLASILTPVNVLPDRHVASLDSDSVILLHGAPGVGKSAIALELTYRKQATFDYVFWLRADSILHLAQSFHEAAVSIGLVRDRKDHNHESSKQKLIAWLSTTGSRWLLIFDDADKLQIIPDFLPTHRSGSIIVTSRQPFREGLHFDHDEHLHTFQIDPFVVEEATKFIRSLAPSAFDAADPAADLATLKTIAENCHCLPLTLRRVGTIISRRGSSNDKGILAILEQNASLVLASQPASLLTYASLSSASFALANAITFLDPYWTDDAILLGAQRYKDFPSSSYPMNDGDYFNAKDELIAHALLAAGADPGILDINRVTARSLRAKLNPNDFREGFHCASRLLEARWPSRRKMKNIVLGNWPEFDSIHSHVHELSSILVEHDRDTKSRKLKQELSNESYLKVLLLSTWYNACRGNAREDQVLVRLAHGLIARSQMSDLRLPQTDTPTTALPARLIDVGLGNMQSPRLVDTAGQTGCYVTLSFRWSSRSPSETRLSMSNMSRLQQGIISSEVPKCVFDAIELTRSLGVRYVWIDSLCINQDDLEEQLNTAPSMVDIYRSALLTIVAVDTIDETMDSVIDSSVLEQPFSMFLDWSRPAIAKSISHRLFTPNTLIQHWNLQEKSEIIFFHYCVLNYLMSKKKKRRSVVVATQTSDLHTPHEGIPSSDQRNDAEVVQSEVETTDTRFDEASREIEQGIHQVEAGKYFEALAFFMKARELVSTFQLMTLRSWKIHAVASANIAIVYRMQHLPAMALAIAEASLAAQSKLSNADCKPTLGRVRLLFVRGGIYNGLEKADESLNCYQEASNDVDTLPEEEEDRSEIADWKGVLGLKLAEHQMRTKGYKEAHAHLQQSLDYFQSQESVAAQAHLARTLHWQSVIYEAQGIRIMGNAIRAAARQTWIGVREAKGRAVTEGIIPLNTDDFDGEVEFWYR